MNGPMIGGVDMIDGEGGKDRWDEYGIQSEKIAGMAMKSSQALCKSNEVSSPSAVVRS